MIEAKKEYYFSYDKIRQHLREMRRMFDINKYDGVTVFDCLLMLLKNEEVGIAAYNEIEWRAFGVNIGKFDYMVEKIEKPDEIVRVFRHLSDHAKDVLPETASQKEIEDFEYECDKIVSKTVVSNLAPVKGGYDENKPYLHMVAGNLDDVRSEWDEKDKILFEHMPKTNNYAYTNLFPFEIIYFAAQRTYAHVVATAHGLSEESFDKDYELPDDINSFVPSLRAWISMEACRPIRNHREPLIQALYIMSVMAREFSNTNTVMGKRYLDFSDRIIKFVYDTYYSDISESVKEATIALRDYRMGSLSRAVHEEVERLEKLGEIESVDDGDNYIEAPKRKNYKLLVKWLEQEKKNGHDYYKEADNNRSEMCRKLTELLGWEVNENSLRKAGHSC